MVLVIAGVVAFRFLSPVPHTPPAEAQRWYDIGTGALRDGAYFQATHALERAIAADDAFMLAHARMAEALVELDYVDRAKDELLRVSSADRARLSTWIRFISMRSPPPPGTILPSQSIHTNALPSRRATRKSPLYCSIWAAPMRTTTMSNGAIKSYTEASTRNPQYATAYLRLGIVFGQQGDLAKALSSFQTAESIYQALGNIEGRTEVVFQRGALFNKRNKLAEARTQLEQALALAKANDNKSQIIKTLLQLSSVSFDAGETELPLVTRATRRSGPEERNGELEHAGVG